MVPYEKGGCEKENKVNTEVERQESNKVRFLIKEDYFIILYAVTWGKETGYTIR